MTVLVSDLINGAAGARKTLIDTAKRTWSDDELVGYVNEFLRQTVFLKPDAFTRYVFVPLVAGTSQQLPDDGVALLNADENATSGRIATQIEPGLMAHANRFWPAATYELDVQHWSHDARDPRRFDVTPPNNGYGALQVLYGAVPDPVSLGDDLPFVDSYEHAAKCFVLAKAYAKNSERQDPGKSERYMAEYRQSLGIKSQGQAAVAPRVGDKG